MFVVLIVSGRKGQTALPSCAVLCQCRGDRPESSGALHSSSEELACSVTEEGLLALLFLVAGPLNQPLC